MPAYQCRDEDEKVRLCSDSPVGKTLPRHHHGNTTRQEHGDDIGLCQLLSPQIFIEVSSLSHTPTGEHKTQESITTEPYQTGLIVIVGNQRCTEKEDEVDRYAHPDIKPEDSIIVAVFLFFLVNQCCGESAVLESIGNGRKHGDHRHQSEILGHKQTGHDDTKYKAQQLLYAVVHASPKEALRRFRLQRLPHSNFLILN